MKPNLAGLEAFLRVFAGFSLCLYFFLGGPFWAAVGVYFLLSGSLRFCFVKKLATG